MPDKPLDRRSRRTRHGLQAALISLILEKGYDSVTIEEVTDRADLGRTTFYLHFRDKEELLMHAIDTICDDFIQQHEALLALVDTSKTTTHSLQGNVDERILHHIFNHARDNADLYKVMLRGEGGATASKRFTQIIQEETIRRLSRLEKLESKVPLEVFAVFFSGTLVEMVTWWLEQDQPFSIEEMVAFYQQLFTWGAFDTLQTT